ncbi:hypothetical+protein [Methylocapsa aurea]|uniref:glycosyltransferase family 2 protein n=1 Tax=Methylocapsa aurea TaxID=663610 RepID=UPI003D18CF10
MIDILGISIATLAFVIGLQALYFFFQVIASMRSASDKQSAPPRRDAPLCVLIPAHDESRLIAATVEAIEMQLIAGDRLLVVADNCSDDTAERARRAGAEVIERRDQQRIGKGYALDRGIAFLADAEPPTVVVFVDADCTLAPGSIAALAAACAAQGRPVQATNLMEASASAGRTARIAQFAWKVKNFVRPLGAERLGMPCQLTGTGMAIPLSLLASVELSTGHIAEDAKLGVELAVQGYAPRFCPSARVTSRFPVTAHGVAEQRTRWEHGHLTMIQQHVPYLLRNAWTQRRPRLLAMALDLSIPPLGLFLLTTTALAGAGLSTTVYDGSLRLVFAAIAPLALFTIAIALAWLRHGRSIVSGRDLLFAPAYALTKLPTLWRFVTKRQIVWVRAERNLD